MGIFRFAFFVLIVLALGSLAASLLGGVASTGLAALGAVVLLPILFFKGLLFLMILGFFASAFCNRGRRWGPPRSRRTADDDRRPAAEERFEEWHRMAHAREEVDSWTPEL